MRSRLAFAFVRDYLLREIRRCWLHKLFSYLSTILNRTKDLVSSVTYIIFLDHKGVLRHGNILDCTLCKLQATHPSNVPPHRHHPHVSTTPPLLQTLNASTSIATRLPPSQTNRHDGRLTTKTRTRARTAIAIAIATSSRRRSRNHTRLPSPPETAHRRHTGPPRRAPRGALRAMPQAHAEQAGVGEYRGVLPDGGEQAGEEAEAGAGVDGGEVGDQMQGELLSQGAVWDWSGGGRGDWLRLEWVG